MVKVILDYDPSTGNIYDGTRAIISTWVGLIPVEEYQPPTKENPLDKLTQLRAMQIDVEEILLLKKEGLL